MVRNGLLDILLQIKKRPEGLINSILNYNSITVPFPGPGVFTIAFSGLIIIAPLHCTAPVTYSHHLPYQARSGGFLLNVSNETSINKLSPRAPRFYFSPSKDQFSIYLDVRFCFSHQSFPFISDIYRCIDISVHSVSTRTGIYSF